MGIFKIVVENRETYFNSNHLVEIDHVKIEKNECSFSLYYVNKDTTTFNFEPKNSKHIEEFRNFFNNIVSNLKKDMNPHTTFQYVDYDHTFKPSSITSEVGIVLAEAKELKDTINLIKKNS